MNLSATSLLGTTARNEQDEDIGDIKEIMLDLDSGTVSYAVLDFGGFLGIGNKLFAVPWSAIRVDTEHHNVIIDVDKEILQNAEGFDQDDWPDFSDRSFEQRIHETYGATPYWH